MMKWVQKVALCAALLFTQCRAEDLECSFVPPKGWKTVSSSLLPTNVKVLVQGHGSNEVLPTLNLAVESCVLTPEQYLATAKKHFEGDGRSEWARLGKMTTQAGQEAYLTQVVQQTKWGDLKVLQALFFQPNRVYLLTASALAEEFPNYYQAFFHSIQSFKIDVDRACNK